MKLEAIYFSENLVNIRLHDVITRKTIRLTFTATENFTLTQWSFIACMGDMIIWIEIVVEQPEDERILTRPRRKWEDNINIKLIGMENESRVCGVESADS
jgi:hypothetical protein